MIKESGIDPLTLDTEKADGYTPKSYKVDEREIELDMVLEQLELTGRGGWRARFDSGAEVELGRGSNDEVLMRSQRFLKTVTQVTARYERNPDALETADLRYEEGYAIRLRGVTTGAVDAQKK